MSHGGAPCRWLTVGGGTVVRDWGLIVTRSLLRVFSHVVARDTTVASRTWLLSSACGMMWVLPDTATETSRAREENEVGEEVATMTRVVCWGLVVCCLAAFPRDVEAVDQAELDASIREHRMGTIVVEAAPARRSLSSRSGTSSGSVRHLRVGFSKADWTLRTKRNTRRCFSRTSTRL